MGKVYLWFSVLDYVQFIYSSLYCTTLQFVWDPSYSNLTRSNLFDSDVSTAKRNDTKRILQFNEIWKWSNWTKNYLSIDTPYIQFNNK